MKGTKDPEFIELRNKFLLGVGACILFGVFIILIFVRIFITDGGVNSKIRKKEDFLIYVDSYDCSHCSEVQKYLDDQNVAYMKFDLNDNYIKKIIQDNKLVKDGIVPGIFYYKDGQMYANLLGMQDTNELSQFLKNHKIVK